MFFGKPNYILPESYKLASRAERKKYCNGCGPKGYDWFVPDNLLGLNITECCNIHDWMYTVGKTQKDKDWADYIFLINMRIAINNVRAKWKTLRKCRLELALFYYTMVKKYGCDSFKFETPQSV